MSEPHTISDQAKPAPVIQHAVLGKLDCPQCASQLSWEIDPRTGIQNPRVLICQNGRCKNYGQRFRSPLVELRPLPPKT